MRPRRVIHGNRLAYLNKLRNAINIVLAMDRREVITAAAQDRDPVLFSTGSGTAVGLALTRLQNRVSEMKDLRA